MYYREAVGETQAKAVQMSSVKVKVSEIPEKLKHLIISLWLHFFLQRIGSKHPEFLSALLIDIDATERQRIIVVSRYVDKLKFKQIPDVKGVNCELRHVMREHKKVIDKLINL